MIISFIILIYSVILHEISHGWVADRLGDPTARLSGRLTLDPRPHIDPWMTIVLPLILVLSGAGIIFGAAKPVPIDSFNFRDPKKDTAITALAGPLTNLLIALILSILARVLFLFIVNDQAYGVIRSILSTGIVWNIGLAVFNLIPIPPLDGSKVLAGVVSDQLANEIYKLEKFGFLIIFGLLFFAPGFLFGITAPIISYLVRLILP